MRSALIWALVATTLLIRQPQPAVWMIGDSTMADRKTPDTTMERGWGTMLAPLLREGVEVRNRAVNGRSTKSFLDEGRWRAVLDSLQAGDVVVIQFGHNDEKREDSTRYAAADGAYRQNLERFVREARARGAIPMLATSIVRRSFDNSGVLRETHGRYPVVTREVAAAQSVPLLDLEQASRSVVSRLGSEAAKSLYAWSLPGERAIYPDGHQDDTHLSDAGARRIAELAVLQWRALGGRLGALVR